MTVAPEHFTWPLRIGSDGLIVTALQDSDAEIESCMAVILSWPLGARETDEEFGIDDQVGLQDGADLNEIRTALEVYEPRATDAVTQDDAALAQFVSDVTVGWSPEQGDGGP